ncbi:surface-adhesin E family protein [Noviherbaspirillum sp. 1P10PC]|uniref:surface-adhesin E family protein n=1 Tax=Noviherbaspirillum sp. 1P10PC TaxID=3132292 RepID=UPI0039A2D098
MTKISAIAFTAAILATPSYASEWINLNPNSTQSFFVDRESIVKSGKNKKVWTIFNLDTKETVPGHPYFGYLSTKSLWYITCDERMFATTSLSFYPQHNAQGDVLTTITRALPETTFKEVEPDTAAEAVIRFVCS